MESKKEKHVGLATSKRKSSNNSNSLMEVSIPLN